MSEFRERFGQLTVGQALELNEAAQQTCESEMTSEIGCKQLRDISPYDYSKKTCLTAYTTMKGGKNVNL